MQLYDFQKEAIDLTRQAFRNNKRVILSLPTGSGKTVIALHIIKKALEKKYGITPGDRKCPTHHIEYTICPCCKEAICKECLE